MKRLTVIVLTVIMMVSSLSFSASAVNDFFHTGHYKSEVIYAENFGEKLTDNSSYTVSPTVTATSFNESVDVPYTFYSFLDNNQKALYNAVKDDPFKFTYTIELPETLTGTGTKNGDEFVPSTDLQNELYKIIIGGVSAVGDDYPDIFWITQLVFGFDYTELSSSGMLITTYKVSISEISVETGYNTSAYTDADALRSLYNQINSVADSVEVKGSTRYEKIKSINKYLCDKVTYDLDAPMAHEPTGVFLAPFHAVCEAYAEAFKMLCDRQGIPSVIVVGYAYGDSVNGGHAWNYVQMEDGIWYAIDTTWNDGVTVLNYSNFLVGSASTFPGTSATTFSDEHTATGQRYIFTGYSLPYPELSENSYSRFLLNDNSKATVDKSKGIVFILNNTTVFGGDSASFLAPYSYTPLYTSDVTGETVRLRDTKKIAVEKYTVVMRGDVVIDGVVDEYDYNEVKRLMMLSPEEIRNELTDAQFEAADMNGDTAIDAFDAFIIEKQITGITNDYY